jgi:hypothetical protein
MLGILFAVQSRRTVTTWIQSSHLFCDFRNVFYHLPQIGQNNDNLLHQFLADLIQSHREIILPIQFVLEWLLTIRQRNITARKSRVAAGIIMRLSTG